MVKQGKKNCQKWSRMVKNGQEWLEMFKNEWSEMAKTAGYGKRWPKWAEFSQNCQIFLRKSHGLNARRAQRMKARASRLLVYYKAWTNTTDFNLIPGCTLDNLKRFYQ